MATKKAVEPVAEKTPEAQVRVRTVTNPGLPEHKRWPNIIGGACEFCGTGVYHTETARLITPLAANRYGVGQCEHYKDVEIRCSYCPAETDWNQLSQRKIRVLEFASTPGELIMVCTDFGCDSRFKEERGLPNQYGF